MIYEFDDLKFWRYVKGERAMRSLTQAQVAKELGVGGGTYSQWESGKRVLPAHRFMAICDMFDLSPIAFYYCSVQPKWKQERLFPTSQGEQHFPKESYEMTLEEIKADPGFIPAEMYEPEDGEYGDWDYSEQLNEDFLDDMGAY